MSVIELEDCFLRKLSDVIIILFEVCDCALKAGRDEEVTLPESELLSLIREKSVIQ